MGDILKLLQVSSYPCCTRAQYALRIFTHPSVQRQFCPPLEPSLCVAISSDFELSTEEGFAAASEALQVIAEAAKHHDSPTSTSEDLGKAAEDGPCARDSRAANGSPPPSGSGLDNLPTQLHSLKVSDESTYISNVAESPADDYINGIKRASDDIKATYLRDMFPGVGDFAVTHTLNKCYGSFERAFDDLLNHSFIDTHNSSNEQDKIDHKGVDAFFINTPNSTPRGRSRTGKKKSKSSTNEQDPSASSTPTTPMPSGSNPWARTDLLLKNAPSTPTQSPWEKAMREVEFISSQSRVPQATISPLYQKSGGSISATVSALLDRRESELAYKHNQRDKLVEIAINDHATELGWQFGSIPRPTLVSLARLTHPSFDRAQELAKALTRADTPKPSSNGAGRIEVVKRYTPIPMATAKDSPPPTNRGARSSNSPSPWTHVVPNNRPSNISPDVDASPSSRYQQSTALASAYSNASSRAFGQAADAYRRGRSDHLMSAAAGYYGQVGRDYATMRREATADAADALVDQQSTPGVIDLHGVSAKDAVRIAKARVQQWWASSSARGVRGLDGRVMREVDGPGSQGNLEIVTGLGRHSREGRPIIGPAVGRMLANDGWQARVYDGVWTVYGKR